MIKFSPLPNDVQVGRESAISASPALEVSTDMCNVLQGTHNLDVEANIFGHDGLRVSLGKGFYEVAIANLGAVTFQLNVQTNTAGGGVAYTPYGITIDSSELYQRITDGGGVPSLTLTAVVDGMFHPLPDQVFNKVEIGRFGRGVAPVQVATLPMYTLAPTN